MRASRVLQKCLGRSLDPMHEARSRVLLRLVEALLAGRRLTLMDVVRVWPDAERVRAPLKAFDRLLSNSHLHQEREQIYGDMARWLLHSEWSVIAIDWSDLKAGKAWRLLRAAVPIGGRTFAGVGHGLSWQTARNTESREVFPGTPTHAHPPPR